jgi:hypothetical protein
MRLLQNQIENEYENDWGVAALPHHPTFQSKIRFGILEADSSHQIAQQSLIVGSLASLDFAAENIAKHSPKIFMSRVGHETARVGQHTDKMRE